MANFDAQIVDLIGWTIDQTACDQWAADACKEIIHQLPANLKAKCSTISIINATNGTTLDLDGIGDILNVTVVKIGEETLQTGFVAFEAALSEFERCIEEDAFNSSYEFFNNGYIKI